MPRLGGCWSWSIKIDRRYTTRFDSGNLSLQMTSRWLQFVFLSCAFLWLMPSASAQLFQKKDKTKVLLNADFTERDNEKDLTILRGNVQIILEQNFISCNEAIVMMGKNEVIAVGKVLLKTPQSDIQADKLVFNFKEQTGKIFNGVVLSGKVLIQSDYIEKTGLDTYVSNSAYLTSCTTCAASWSFTADEIDATIEGYAYIKNSWLHVLEVPLIYFPYLIVPLKNERQSGVLTPTMGNHPYAGFGLEIPYFWAISRSQDMTLSAKHFDSSGFQGLVNYRYRLSQKSSGELDTAMLWDKAMDGKRRWHANYEHYLELPNDYIQRTTISLTSDLDYVNHFQQQFPFFGLPALDNRTSITKNFEDFHLSVDTSYYISLLQDSIADGRETSVHRLPEVRFSLSDRKLFDNANIFYRLNGQYINIARQGFGFDSLFTPPGAPEGYRPGNVTGVFDSTTDKVRTGQRLDIQQMLYMPMRLMDNAIDFTPYASYRHTQYVLGAINEQQNFDFFPHRNYTQVGVNTSTEMSAIYQGGSSRYRHSMIPEVSFQAITNANQTNSTFFGSQNQIPYFLQTQPLQNSDVLNTTDGRGLQFDYEDRIIGKRLVNFAFTNKIAQKSDSPLGQVYNQPVLFTVSQAYDIIESKNDNGRPWQDIRGLLNVRTGRVDSLTEFFHFPYHKQTNVNSRLRLALENTNYFEVIYTNYLNVPADPADIQRSLRQESALLAVGLDTKTTALFSNIEYSLKDSEWRRWTVNATLTPPGDCWIIGALLYKNLDTDEIGWDARITFKFGK